MFAPRTHGEWSIGCFACHRGYFQIGTQPDLQCVFCGSDDLLAEGRPA